jgi:formylglycine-generating enzyme required for sulfatase activity
MTGKVFISYRRDDSAGHAGRVHDRLELEFGRDLLFMDVDAVPLGMNFIKILDEAVAKCDALLAVIGPNWLDLRDKDGNRRLDDPHDYVRIEIAAALQRDIPVIPVLLDGAEIPRVDQLPKDIEELALRNGLYVRHASFHNDMDRLIAGLRAPLGQLDAPVPEARRSSTQERAGLSTAERRVAAGAAEQQQGASASAPWLRPATIAFGTVLVLAGAIFGLVIVKAPPGSSSRPPISPMQSVPQSPKQTAQLPTAPVKPSLQATPKAPEAIQPSQQATPKAPEATPPLPQTAQPPAAVVQPSPQVVQQPSVESQPPPQAAQYSTASAPPALKTARPPFEPLSSIAERALQPGDSFKECDGCPEMVVLPAGAFTMGSPENERGRFSDESPQHVVTFTRPFAIGKFEITVDQFAAFVKETAYDAGSKCLTLEEGKSAVRDGRSWRNPGYPQTGSHPVACVNWNDAKAYLGWLTKKIGKQYRLLTESEWEYAARAKTTPGSTSRYTFGDDDSAMCKYGNVADKTARQTIPGADTWTVFPCSDGYAYAAPVGTFAANAFGLYDVHGNVWQWTEDCYNTSYNGAPTDGSPWIASDCDHRVVRGGMWGSSPANVRLARRFKNPNDMRSQGTGFRVARTMEP